ncbi:hypothetical protein SE23_10455 [Vibrio sinaloensis]|uniref:DUF3305 domain-containing protein n=1 Tax=Photobacterium sp. (strain ATCC 43367) TaxID=379097 RepID=UPI00057D6F4F|nr:DUF3305 domain-containing protein [Vibrio sinaloensis]KIE20615.1 hypothetical protein SE23_10455 [Vibrio sinaloensis]
MSKQPSTQATLTKTEELWPIQCELISHEISTGIWVTTQWQLSGFELAPNNASQNVALLQLHRDERTDYRFNLSSQQPKLFLVLDSVDNDDEPNIVALTASQSVAGQYMDGDYLVLSKEMPLPVQAWMEAYIGRHGELLEQRRKKRKGAGRASGN